MSKIQVTQQQRDNLLDALNVMWPSVPPENVAVRLLYWRQGDARTKADCGTVACFGGWVAAWPAFKAQGVRADRDDGAPLMREKIGPAYVSHCLFGYMDLFRIRNSIEIDGGFYGTDHELVTHRLQWLLDNSEVAK